MYMYPRNHISSKYLLFFSKGIEKVKFIIIISIKTDS